MTLTATWINGETPTGSLWMASDSRISDGEGVLLDEGAKLFELPVVCRGPGPSGFFDQTYLDTRFGLVCSGSTVIFHQVYATLIPSLGNLAGYGHVPALQDVAALVARMTTLFTRSLGVTRPRGAYAALVVAGVDPITSTLQAFEISPELDDERRISFQPAPADLEEDRVLFTGDSRAIASAEHELDVMRANPVPGRPYHRAALNVIRKLAQEDGWPTVGGDVQIGFTRGARFQRVATVTPRVHGHPIAQQRLNNIDLDELGSVGPCAVSLDGMVSP